MRKFALLVVIDEFGTMVLGKTCRFCTPCDLLMVHQDELEHELVVALEPRAPDAIGNEYVVFGTVDKKSWSKGLEGNPAQLGDILDHAADFKKELNLEYDPGGWRPDPEKRCDTRHEIRAGRERLAGWRHRAGFYLDATTGEKSEQGEANS